MEKCKLNALMLALMLACSTIAVTEEEHILVREGAPELEVFEVRGFSRSLTQSSNQKCFYNSASEQLLTDDMGALPDAPQTPTRGGHSTEFDQSHLSHSNSLIEGVVNALEFNTASPLNNDQQHKLVANLRGMHNNRASELFEAT